jgi:uncharacterized protein YdhG (YjbR/CyaY superfamily)
MMKNSKPTTVDEYLAAVPEPAQTTLRQVQATIRSIVPAATTEKISYGMPTFHYLGALVGFAAFNNHCSFFPYSAALVQEFAADLKKYETAKGTIRFPKDKPLSATLLKKLVKARIAQNEAKKKKKA